MTLHCHANPIGGAGDPSPRPRGYAWRVVAMLWLVCFFNYADRQAIFSVFPRLHDEFGFSKLQLGLVGSAFMWVYAAGAPLAGLVGDRLRRKDLILGGCLFWSAVTASTAWCHKLWQFTFVRAAEGLGETFYFPASVSLTSDYHGPATRSRALSFHQSGVYLGTIAGSWFGAFLAERHGWRTSFYFFGIAGTALAVVLYRFLREPRRGQGEPIADAVVAPPLALRELLVAVFHHPAAALLMLAFFGANFVAMVFLTWTPTFLVEKFNFGLARAGLYATLFIQLSSAASVPVAGWLADRFVRKLPGGRVWVQAAGLLVGAAFVAWVGRATTVAALVVAMSAFGLCKGFYDSGIFASLYDVVEPRARATAAGIMNTVGWAGGAMGPLAIGWAAGHWHAGSEVANMSRAISLGGIVYVAGAGLLIGTAMLLGRHKTEPGPTPDREAGTPSCRVN